MPQVLDRVSRGYKHNTVCALQKQSHIAHNREEIDFRTEYASGNYRLKYNIGIR